MNYVFHILLNDPNSSFLNRFGNTHIFLIISLHQMMFIHSHSFIFSLPALSFLFSGSHTLSVALIISQWAVFIHCTTYQKYQGSCHIAYFPLSKPIPMVLNTIYIFVILRFMHLVRICFWRILNWWYDICTWMSQYNLICPYYICSLFSHQFSSLQGISFFQVRDAWGSF